MTSQAHVDRAVLVLTSALQRIAQSSDCYRVLDQDDGGPCDCPVHLARAALEHAEDWRFRGSFWQRAVLRPDQWPHESRALVAWRAFMTRDPNSAGSADAKLAKVIGRAPTASDWWTATSVLQWLHTGVGSSILSAAGWIHREGDAGRAWAGPPFGRVRDAAGVVHRTGWIGRRARLCELRALVVGVEVVDEVTCPSCLALADADRAFVAEERARLADEQVEGRTRPGGELLLPGRLLDRLDRVLDWVELEQQEYARLVQSVAAALGQPDLRSRDLLVAAARDLRAQADALASSSPPGAEDLARVVREGPGQERAAREIVAAALRRELHACEERGSASEVEAGCLRAVVGWLEVAQPRRDRVDELEDAIETALDALAVGVAPGEVVDRLRAALGEEAGEGERRPDGDVGLVRIGELTRARQEAQRAGGWTTPSPRAAELAGQLAVLAAGGDLDLRAVGWTSVELREVSDLLFAAYGDRSLAALEHGAVGVLTDLAKAVLSWRATRRAAASVRGSEARLGEPEVSQGTGSAARLRVDEAGRLDLEVPSELGAALARVVP